MATCPRCQSEVATEDAFCRRCGAQLGGAADRQSFMDDMLAPYQRRLKDKQDDPDALYNIGLALLHSDRCTEALSSFERVVELQPEFTDARVKLAVCLWNAGQPEKALQQIQMALDQAPGHRRAHELRSRMRQQMGLEPQS